MMDYQSIVAGFLNGEAGKYIPDGMAFSFPVATRDPDGAVIDNFFVYGVDLRTAAASSPAAYIGMYSETGKIAYYRTAGDVRFPEEAPSEALPYEEFTQLTGDYARLYPAVRRFATAPMITGEQRALLLEYFDVQRRLFADQMGYYRGMAPAFYSWMLDKAAPTITFLGRCQEGEANPGELNVYLDMAGDDEDLRKRILGLTDAEFEAWKAKGNNMIRLIAHSRIMGEDFTTYQDMSQDQLLAARSWDPDAIDKIKHEKDT